jgi:hypothetical protein
VSALEPTSAVDIVVGATETSNKTNKLFVYREAELVQLGEEFNVPR